MSDDGLDRLIDDVARQMTAGQPSSDFRARVIASLDRRPRRVWRPMWIAAPLVATTAIVLAMVVARPFKGRDRGTESPAIRQSSQAVSAETAAAAPTPDTTTVRLKPDTTYGEAHERPGVAAAGRRQDLLSGAAATIDALAPLPLEPAPIGVAALGIEALPTESIAVRQLDAIAPIGIAPLPADDARPSGGANEETSTTLDRLTLDYRPDSRLPTRLLTTDY
jgi:hypothetical protein